MINKTVVAGSIALCVVGLAAPVAQASNFRQTVSRTTDYSPNPATPSEGQAVPIWYVESQDPGCPTPHQTFLYLGINGTWSVIPMTMVTNSCSPFNSGGAASYRYIVPPQPAGTVVEYVVNIPGTTAQWLKAGSNLAYNEWNKGYSYYGSYQNFRYVTESFFDAVYHWPPNGQCTAQSDLWINAETYPAGVATYARVVYSTNGGASWQSKDMELGGQVGNNDWWHVNLGKFTSRTTIRYAIEVRDANDKSIWANNNGADYRATVN
jgi:hypothetical protein